MKPVYDIDYNELTCRTRDKEFVRLHFDIVLYFAYIHSGSQGFVMYKTKAP